MDGPLAVSLVAIMLVLAIIAIVVICSAGEKGAEW